MTITAIALILPKLDQGFPQNTVPLNLAYLASSLRLHGFRVKGFNLYYDHLTPSDIKSFQLFGISSTSASFNQALTVALHIKKHHPNAFIVLGGSHATAMPSSLLAHHPTFDALITGEGEIPLVKLIKALNSHTPLSKVPNLVFRHQSGKIIANHRQLHLHHLDHLPLPDKSVFDTSAYPDQIQAYGDIIASRGCPYRCANCKPGLDHISSYRLRHPDRVVDEIVFLKKTYHVNHFTFSDSELAGPKAWIINLCQAILDRNLKITFSCNGRTDQVDATVLKYLKKAGCTFIGYGIESGSQNVIDTILHKAINLKQSFQVVNQTTKFGIGVGVWFMVGIPGETFNDIQETITFASSLNCWTIEINIATPWPDTEFYRVCQTNHWLISDDFSSFNEKNRCVVSTPFLSSSQTIFGFNLFKNYLLNLGWKEEPQTNRFYHPRFLSLAISANLKKIITRGLSSSDIHKFTRFLKVSLSCL